MIKDLYRWPFLIILFVVGFCYYGIYRNNKVLAFKMQMSIQKLYMDRDDYNFFKDTICTRYTYLDYLLSFRPLKSKYWFSEEEIRKYKLELVDEAVK